jgi:hypothetical protein
MAADGGRLLGFVCALEGAAPAVEIFQQINVAVNAASPKRCGRGAVNLIVLSLPTKNNDKKPTTVPRAFSEGKGAAA